MSSNELKSSIYRLKLRVPSQLRTPTLAAARFAREIWPTRGGSQLRDILIAAAKATRFSTMSDLASHSSIFIFVYFTYPTLVCSAMIYDSALAF